MKKWIIIALVVVGVLALTGFGIAKYVTSRYNQFIVMGQNVDKSWSQVENVMQRRFDLIPNLVNVVQAYAIQEQTVFIKVAEARSGYLKAMQGGTIPDKMKANTALSGALMNLMAVSENYPDLKSNQNFLALQDELAGTENRISVERMRYNEAVQAYNSFSKQFPNNFIVKMFNIKPERDFFEAVAAAQTAPQVNINFPPQGQVPAVAPAVPAAPIGAPTAAPVPAPAQPTTPPPLVPQSAITPQAPAAPTTAQPAPQAMAAPSITPPQALTAPAVAPVAPPATPPTAPSINVPPPAAATATPLAKDEGRGTKEDGMLAPKAAEPVTPPTVAPATPTPAPTGQLANPPTGQPVAPQPKPQVKQPPAQLPPAQY